MAAAAFYRQKLHADKFGGPESVVLGQRRLASQAVADSAQMNGINAASWMANKLFTGCSAHHSLLAVFGGEFEQPFVKAQPAMFLMEPPDGRHMCELGIADNTRELPSKCEKLQHKLLYNTLLSCCIVVTHATVLPGSDS